MRSRPSRTIRRLERLRLYLAEQGQLRQAEACYRAAVEINPCLRRSLERSRLNLAV